MAFTSQITATLLQAPINTTNRTTTITTTSNSKTITAKVTNIIISFITIISSIHQMSTRIETAHAQHANFSHKPTKRKPLP